MLSTDLDTRKQICLSTACTLIGLYLDNCGPMAHAWYCIAHKQTFMSIQTNVLWNVVSVYRNVQEECPAPSFVHTKCKNCAQVRLHSSLAITTSTRTLGRERESNQKVSPPININLTNLYKQKNTHNAESLDRLRDSEQRGWTAGAQIKPRGLAQ